MKKVLIITYSFPPLNNIASRRFGEIAPYLSKYGWEPYILTTESSGTIPISLQEEQIFRYSSHPQKSVEIRKNKNKGIQSKVMNFKRSLGFNLRLFDRTYFDWYRTIVQDENHFSNIKFDLILASFGPAASLYLGKHLSDRLKVPWIADFRDLGALYKDDYYKQNFLFKYIDKKIEKSLISNADAITSIGSTLTKMLGQYYEKPSYTIYNGWTETPQMPMKPTNNKYIYYAGRFYPHQLESIFKVINILKKYNDIKLIIRSLGPEELNKKVISYAINKGVNNQVEVLDPIDQDTVLKESQGAIANLVIEDLNKEIYWKKGTLTGKFLGLLPLNPPILAVARDDSEIGEILEYTQKGRLCSKEYEIDNFLGTVSDYSLSANITFYSKINQAERLADVFNQVLKKDYK